MTHDPRPFSPGLAGVIGAETAIGFVDGVNGRLLYRGVPIEQVVAEGTYASVAEFLLTGTFDPSARMACAPLSDGARQAIRALSPGAHPMDALRTGLSAHAADAAFPWPPTPEQARELIGVAPTILAAFARHRHGLLPIEPDPSRGIADGFLFMLHGAAPLPSVARALEAYLMACAEHGLNASTFTARVIVATRSDIGSAIVGAIGALKGPLHGGAPAEVIGQLAEIGGADKAAAWARAKIEKRELIMGFGHRVYRAYDPRAAALRAVAEAMPTKPEWLAEAIAVEDEILRTFAEMKPDRPIKTNVEFYAAPVIAGTGLAPELFPAAFALGRMAGWSAHVIEQAGQDKLIRPDARYVGPAERSIDDARRG